VKPNKGSPRIDGMTVEALPGPLEGALASHPRTTSSRDQQATAGEAGRDTKPDGGARQLGIPTVLDRMVQQAVMQVLQSSWDAGFSEHSYGFLPGRSAHKAVAKAQKHIAEGCGWVVDLDLEKFFNRVNRDKLMAAVARRVKDKRLFKLIRAFPTVGVMEDGLVSSVDDRTPQGGPLSLQSNLVLDELDDS
jgi:RNA-directed DNA polymerase